MYLKKIIEDLFYLFKRIVFKYPPINKKYNWICPKCNSGRITYVRVITDKNKLKYYYQCNKCDKKYLL